MHSDRRSTYVTKFDSRKDFMAHLESMMISEEREEEEEEFGEEIKKHPTELKTYYLESNNGLPQNEEIEDLKVKNIPTTLPSVNVIRLEYKKHSAIYYLDSSDPRFLLLYTNGLATTTDRLFNLLINTEINKLDNIWLPTETQNELSQYTGNIFTGFSLFYDDKFTPRNRELPIGELKMSMSGASSAKVLSVVSKDASVRNSICYSKIRVERGDARYYISDEIRYTGRVITKSGRSIDDHINILEIIRRKYKELIEKIEGNSLGVKTVEGRTLVEGQAYDLTLEREIPNLDTFSENLLDSDNPFRIWGMVNNISPDMRQIVGLDLHTGDPINLEVTPSLIRVYIPKGGCGNSVLRLYVNLQHHYDSKIRLNEE